MEFQNAMVIGAGQMGGGIARVFAGAGMQVYLNDVDDSVVMKRVRSIEKMLEKDVAKGRITQEDSKNTLARIHPSVSLGDAAGCGIVVEAIVENMHVKGEVFRKLDEITGKDCILATNTSSLPITEIAAVTGRPEQVIGMHFMNPVPVMSLVEIIRGLATSDKTYRRIKTLSQQIGKFPVEVRDVPGFVSNRVLQVMINEAVFCLYEGVADASGVDEIMKRGMNHPMGPLQLADFIGLDTVLSILEIMYRGYGDTKYRPCPLLRQYVKAGWLGKKAGKGFYEYDK